jgi:hypothetical protein
MAFVLDLQSAPNAVASDPDNEINTISSVSLVCFSTASLALC